MINCALSWFSLNEYIEMHGQQNLKLCMYVCSHLHDTFPAHLILNTNTRVYRSWST